MINLQEELKEVLKIFKQGLIAISSIILALIVFIGWTMFTFSISRFCLVVGMLILFIVVIFIVENHKRMIEHE